MPIIESAEEMKNSPAIVASLQQNFKECNCLYGVGEEGENVVAEEKRGWQLLGVELSIAETNPNNQGNSVRLIWV